MIARVVVVLLLLLTVACGWLQVELHQQRGINATQAQVITYLIELGRRCAAAGFN